MVNYGKHLPEAVAANLQYGFPGRKLRVIGVTGTDGKTTTVNMVYQILKEAGKKVSMISTINAVIAGKNYDTGFHVTSPKPPDIQKYLKMALDHGDEFMVLEVTSHALDQLRVWGVLFEIGVITNVTPEHLDYHKTFENYLKSKLKLIKNSKWAVVNHDDQQLIQAAKNLEKGKLVTFGLTKKADVNPVNFPLRLRLIGDYNLTNGLAAVVVANVLEIDQRIVRKSLENFEPLEGRMEFIPNSRGLKIVVDFAHTPNALKNALKTLRKITTGEIISVFGCASERDTGKRPVMGKIAAELSDVTVLTDEDPRFEDSLKIIDEIAAGGKFKGRLFKESNRMRAIKLGICLAKKGDLVAIFGKGHERSMNYRGVEKTWSDKEAVFSVLDDK